MADELQNNEVVEAAAVPSKKELKKQAKAEKKAAKAQAKEDKKRGRTGNGATPIDENGVPVVKTKKEIEMEQEELRRHKKLVRREAREHSAKTTKRNRILLSILSAVVIICMVLSTVLIMMSAKNLSNPSSGAISDGTTTAQSPSSSASPSQSAAPAQSSSEPAQTPADNGGGEAAAPGTVDPSDKASVVAYYKAAHARALSSATKATRVYDNTTNYNSVLEIGDSGVISKIAQSLMGQFLKENTEALECTGADIAANLPPAGGSSDGLTPDMIGEFSCTDNGDSYTITLKIDSSEENYDTGEKTGNLCTTVSESAITEAASMVKFEGLENRYIGPSATATIDKATGNLTHLETDVPSYLTFAKVSVTLVSVQNARIGLEYMQKWDITY